MKTKLVLRSSLLSILIARLASTMLFERNHLAPIDQQHICSVCKCSGYKSIVCLLEKTSMAYENGMFDLGGLDPRLEKLLLDLEFLNMNLIIGPNTFSRMKHLKILCLNLNKRVELSTVPDLTHASHIEELTIQNSLLNQMDRHFCDDKTRLKKIDFSMNLLHNLAYCFDNCTQLNLLDLSYNRISSLCHMFNEPSRLVHLILDENNLEKIDLNDLRHLTELVELSMSKNKLEFIHANAFDTLTKLTRLDLSKNNLYSMPPTSVAYKSLEVLKVSDNLNFLYFPNDEEFYSLQTLEAAYPYHCCQFLKRSKQLQANPNANNQFVNYEVANDVFNLHYYLQAEPIEAKTASGI